MKTHRITGGEGVQLHVVETGNPQNRPIVFIHGVSQCWLQWSRQMNSSLVEDHRLVALDMRGHGLSDKPRHGYDDSKQWADDINAVIQALNLDHPVLSGWSYGPLVFLDYIRHYGGIESLASTSSERSRSLAAKTPFWSSLRSFSASSHSSSQRTQKRMSVVWRACCGCVSPRSHRPSSCISRWDTTSPSRRMSVRGCSHAPSTTTISCRRSASLC